MKYANNHSIGDKIFPYYIRYDAQDHANVLFDREPKLRARLEELNLNRVDLSHYLEASYRQNAYFFEQAKKADSLDTICAAFGLFVDAMLSVSLLGGIAVTIIEEGVEMIRKVPFYGKLWKTGKGDRITGLLVWEAASLIPFFGEGMDMLNRYVREAYSIIEEDAITAIAARTRIKVETLPDEGQIIF